MKTKRIFELAKALWIWTHLTVHNTWGIFNVFFIVWVRPMKGGVISVDHPMATGINPDTNDYIWKENMIFQSPRGEAYQDSESDDEIVCAVGKYMSKMVQASAASAEHPHGKPDRMPPAINYIHGSVHYNGGFLIFDDFQDAINHYSNKDFQKSFKQFVKEEGREPVTIFRNKNYNREEYLDFVCFLRTIFPWFSNTNGNKKRIGWGNPAPYASTNTITGYWKDDTYKFYNAEARKTLCRKAIAKRYFTQASYVGERNFVLPEEKWLANFTNERVLARGEKGNMFFVDLRKLAKGYKFDPAKPLPNILDRLKERIVNYLEQRQSV
jgi:hypothetical protein